MAGPVGNCHLMTFRIDRRDPRIEMKLDAVLAVEFRAPERQPVLGRAQRTVVPEDRWLADLQVDVACAAVDGVPEQGVQIHAPSFGRAPTLL